MIPHYIRGGSGGERWLGAALRLTAGKLGIFYFYPLLFKAYIPPLQQL